MKKFIGLIIILLLAGGLYYGYQNYWASREQVPFHESREPVVYHEGLLQDDTLPFIIREGQLLLAADLAEPLSLAEFFWDAGEATMVITTYDKVIRFQPERMFYMENGRPVDLPVPMEIAANRVYLPLAFLEEFLAVDWLYREEEQVLVLDEKRECRLMAEVITDSGVIRQKPSLKAPLYTEPISPGDMLLVYETHEHWLKVRTESGMVGYIHKKDVKRYEECRPVQGPASHREAAWQPQRGKINLVWEAVYSANPNPAQIPPMPGLDVVSPTWYEIMDEDGNISQMVSQRYIDWAHGQGYVVWPLVSNGFDPDRTSGFLASTATREAIIDELLQSVLTHNMDGLNIDFENVYLSDRDLVTQFVRELTPVFREEGLIVSMDVTIRSTSEMWSMFYDREALGEVVDYMAIMTYDQHWGSSPVAGSVAQYEWVKNGLEGVLEQVPPHKVLLGLPTYTRIWEEEEVEGEIRVSSRAVSMGQVQQLISSRNLELTWDEVSGQYYTEYMEGGNLQRIWVEDPRSIDLKSSLVHRYNLAGTASWRRGFETPDIWEVLEHNLKEMPDYESWARSRGLTDRIF